MASQSNTTRDHEEIREWAESRGGIPTIVKGTGGLLRIDFIKGPKSGGRAASLEETSWNEWFKLFDENGLVFLHSQKPDSKFFKLIAETTAQDRKRGIKSSVHRPARGGANARRGRTTRRAGAAKKGAAARKSKATDRRKSARRTTGTRSGAAGTRTSARSTKTSGRPATRKSTGTARSGGRRQVNRSATSGRTARAPSTSRGGSRSASSRTKSASRSTSSRSKSGSRRTSSARTRSRRGGREVVCIDV